MRYLLFSLVIACSGCAALQEGDAQQTGKKLSEAGFRVYPADTAAKQRTLASLPPYTLEESSKGDLYRYADPGAGLLYVGHAGAYQRYQQLVTKTHSRRATNLAQLSNRRVTGPMLW